MRLKILSSILALIVAGLSTLACAKTQQPIDTISIDAKAVKSPSKCLVVLPQKYLEQGDTAHYPVVYLIHGYGGDYTSWLKLTEPRLDSLATVHNMIFVCPDGRDSWYWDSPVVPELQMETFFTTELVPYIDNNYRTKASKK